MVENWRNLHELIEYSKGGILSKVVSKTDKSNVTLFCMASGTELSEHRASREAVIVVLEGNGAFILEGKPIKMLPGVFISMKKGAPHSLTVDENTSFLLVLF